MLLKHQTSNIKHQTSNIKHQKSNIKHQNIKHQTSNYNIKLWDIQYYKKKCFFQMKVITMMKNYDKSVEINHNPNWPYIPDCPYRIFGGSGSDKTNVLLNLIKHQRPDIDKNCLYVKDSFESKYQLLINGRKSRK